MSLGLSTNHPLGIILGLVGSLVHLGRLGGRFDGWRGCCGRIAGFHANGERTAAAATRLVLGVKAGLGLGLSFLLLLAATLDQRRADNAAALLANPAAVVGDLLLPLLRQLWFGLSPFIGVVPLVAVWFSEIRILTHRGTKYRPVRT